MNCDSLNEKFCLEIAIVRHFCSRSVQDNRSGTAWKHTQNGEKIKPDILQINTRCMLLNESKGKEITGLRSQMRYWYYK